MSEPDSGPGETGEAEELARFFGSYSDFEKILKADFRQLYEFIDLKASENHANILVDFQTVLNEVMPTRNEGLNAHIAVPLRKELRDRFIDGMRRIYDKHFPRPGGRAPNIISRHEAAVARVAGKRWKDISTKDGSIRSDDDRSRKELHRGRVDLVNSCRYLIVICGPDSSAPSEVKAEYVQLRKKSLTQAP